MTKVNVLSAIAIIALRALWCLLSSLHKYLSCQAALLKDHNSFTCSLNGRLPTSVRHFSNAESFVLSRVLSFSDEINYSETGHVTQKANLIKDKRFSINVMFINGINSFSRCDFGRRPSMFLVHFASLQSYNGPVQCRALNMSGCLVINNFFCDPTMSESLL